MFDLMKIGEVVVNVDVDGRYCLNDLHKASGGAEKDAPSKWLRNSQTIGLIEELQTGQICPVTKMEGRNGGTYVCKELVYCYAMWISPAFHIKVVRAYDYQVSRPSQEVNPKSELPSPLNNMLLGMSAPAAARSVKAVPFETEKPLNLEKVSISRIIKYKGCRFGAPEANQALEAAGLIRKGRDAGYPGSVWRLTEDGLRYGEDFDTLKDGTRTEPRWYLERADELCEQIKECIDDKRYTALVPALIKGAAEIGRNVDEFKDATGVIAARQVTRPASFINRIKNMFN